MYIVNYAVILHDPMSQVQAAPMLYSYICMHSIYVCIYIYICIVIHNIYIYIYYAYIYSIYIYICVYSHVIRISYSTLIKY